MNRTLRYIVSWGPVEDAGKVENVPVNSIGACWGVSATGDLHNILISPPSLVGWVTPRRDAFVLHNCPLTPHSGQLWQYTSQLSVLRLERFREYGTVCQVRSSRYTCGGPGAKVSTLWYQGPMYSFVTVHVRLCRWLLCFDQFEFF